jgi:hypothetical protein
MISSDWEDGNWDDGNFGKFRGYGERKVLGVRKVKSFECVGRSEILGG